MTLPPAFAALGVLRRFVTYDIAPDPDRPGKTIKRPTDVRTGHFCKVTDPAHHYSYDEAALTGRPVGFVFVEADGFFFIDIDQCLEKTPAGAQWSAIAVEICQRFAGCAVEVSQSGLGLHIIGRGHCPPHSCRNIPLGLELYTDQRFVALTGVNATGDCATDATAALAPFVERYFPPNAVGDIAGWSTEPVPEWKGPTDDAELLRIAMASGQRSGAARFGDGVTFADLWSANAPKLAKKWPPSSPGAEYGASEADAALASHLAFWTGKNHERIRDLMWQSELARPKWEDRPDWLDMTIMKAASVVTAVATGREPVLPPGGALGPSVGSPAPSDGLQAVRDTGTVVHAPQPRVDNRDYLGADDQLSFFAGCVYVRESHSIWTPQSGVMLDKARFDVEYNGHVFALDGENRKTTDSAFEAFTKSRLFDCPKADYPVFRPELPPGQIVVEGKLRLVNTYVPVETPRVQGDAGPFIRHLEKLFPDPADMAIIVNYMASLLQNPGRKFSWWPVIQGAEGNGKSLLTRAMTFCVGARYSHLVNPEAMARTGNQFNAWIEGKLFLSVEEFNVGNRRDFLETFKTVVTDDRVAIEGKGQAQRSGDNRLNGMIFTNHADGVPVDADKRRYAIFHTPQQSAADIVRDGMGGDYFPQLYSWFYGGGQAVINDWLRRFPVDAALDPAGACHRAPRTTSTDAAIMISRGRAEQEILEAIEEGRVGFSGGWVSSIWLGRLLDSIKAPINRNKRTAVMRGLGFIPHPGLPEGRSSAFVALDGGRPALYVRPGHLSINFSDPMAIIKAYQDAQGRDGNIDASALRR